VSLEKFNIPGDCEPGTNKGDVYGTFYVNWTDGQGRQKSSKILSVARENSKKIQSGNDYAINRHVDVERYYRGGKFEIKGELKEMDEGLKGADDQIGAWKFNLSRKAQGKQTKRAHGSTCYPGNAKQPLMYYGLSRRDYIYPPE